MKSAVILIVLAGKVGCAVAASAQSSQVTDAAKRAEQAAAKQNRKVWTNEDLIALRTPEDIYLFEKEAMEAAAIEEARRRMAAAKQAGAGAAPGSPAPSIKLPETIEQTQKIIDEDLEEISNDEDVLPRLKQQLENAPDDQKAAKQEEIDQITQDLNEARDEVQVLRKHLEELRKGPVSESPADKS
jgi:DNA repair exonuclease SbcCD ATPase subunit